MCGGKWSEARIKRQVYSQAALPKSDNMGYSAAGGGLVLGGRRMRQAVTSREVIALVQEQGREQVNHRVAAEMKRKGQCDSPGEGQTREISEREEPKMEMSLTACLLYLPQLTKICYIT